MPRPRKSCAAVSRPGTDHFTLCLVQLQNVLRRLQSALPGIRDWITHLLAAQAANAQSVSNLRLPRLAAYFPEDLLRTSRLVVVNRIPFPPVQALGLPEFNALAAMPLAGITFQDTFFALRGQDTEGLCFHELVHVVQWRTLGPDAFLLTYATGILQHGYEASPLEAIAFAAQEGFEQQLPFPALVDAVRTHALATRASVAELFRENGLDLGV